ncbi:hypothetical protein C8J56DRAFT_893784 [Mycena floridula]|nr:hypothetical protein C8J56DRAFT_893784 [Mycena floridula]
MGTAWTRARSAIAAKLLGALVCTRDRGVVCGGSAFSVMVKEDGFAFGRSYVDSRKAIGLFATCHGGFYSTLNIKYGSDEGVWEPWEYTFPIWGCQYRKNPEISREHYYRLYDVLSNIQGFLTLFDYRGPKQPLADELSGSHLVIHVSSYLVGNAGSIQPRSRIVNLLNDEMAAPKSLLTHPSISQLIIQLPSPVGHKLYK